MLRIASVSVPQLCIWSGVRNRHLVMRRSLLATPTTRLTAISRHMTTSPSSMEANGAVSKGKTNFPDEVHTCDYFWPAVSTDDIHCAAVPPSAFTVRVVRNVSNPCNYTPIRRPCCSNPHTPLERSFSTGQQV